MRTEHVSRQTGPITLHIDVQAADVQVVADPRVTGTWIELSTPDESGPAVTAIRNARFHDTGGDVYLSLKEASGGTVTGVQFGHGNIRVNGMTMVNGVVHGAGSTFSSGGITVRAITETGSAVDVKTWSGDVVTKNVAAVRAKTMSGDIEVGGIVRASQLKSMSGDIRVSASPAVSDAAGAVARRDAAGPRVQASTMSGDITGVGVDLDGKSMSGRVRQHRPTAADEW